MVGNAGALRGPSNRRVVSYRAELLSRRAFVVAGIRLMGKHDFCRTHLRIVMEDVKRLTIAEQRKGAWVWHDGRQMAEFHGPDKFYWSGNACCKWEARAKGWEAWLREFHPEFEQNTETTNP